MVFLKVSYGGISLYFYIISFNIIWNKLICDICFHLLQQLRGTWSTTKLALFNNKNGFSFFWNTVNITSLVSPCNLLVLLNYYVYLSFSVWQLAYKNTHNFTKKWLTFKFFLLLTCYTTLHILFSKAFCHFKGDRIRDFCICSFLLHSKHFLYFPTK